MDAPPEHACAPHKAARTASLRTQSSSASRVPCGTSKTSDAWKTCGSQFKKGDAVRHYMPCVSLAEAVCWNSKLPFCMANPRCGGTWPFSLLTVEAAQQLPADLAHFEAVWHKTLRDPPAPSGCGVKKFVFCETDYTTDTL